MYGELIGVMRTVCLAGLFAALSAGCGSIATGDDDGGGGSDSDSGVGDDSSVADASPPDAETMGMITVNVFAGGAPAAGIAVMYSMPDGSYVDSVTTDANGVAEIPDMPVNGVVTAPVNPYRNVGSTINFLTSVAGVQIGDVITLGRGDDGRRAGPVGFLNVGMPVDGNGRLIVVPGATNSVVRTACGSRSVAGGTLNSQVDLLGGCIPATNQADVVAYALDAMRARLAYTTASAVPLTGSEPNLTGSATLPAWSMELGTYKVDLSNAPDTGNDTRLFMLWDGYKQGVRLDAIEDSATVASAGSTSHSFVMAPEMFEEMTVTVAWSYRSPTVRAGSTVISLRDNSSPTAAVPVTRSFDLTSEVMQQFGDVTATAVDPIAISWAETSQACRDNPEPDALLTIVEGTQVMAAAPDVRYRWLLLAPGDSAPGITLPSIDPAMAATLWPTTTFDTVEAHVVFKSDSTMTYDDFRADIHAHELQDFRPAKPSTRCINGAGFLGGG